MADFAWIPAGDDTLGPAEDATATAWSEYEKICCIMAFLPVVLCGPLLAQDIDGGDHPALPRYPQAVIDGYRAPALAEAPTNRQLLEGKVTHIDYRVKPATAPLQIQRYCDDLLKQGGFSIAYACVGPACGRDMGSLILNSGKVAPTGLADGLFNDKIRVVVAHRADTWVVLHIAEGPDRSQIFEAVVEGASAR